jgi:tocopherol cyclase
MKFSLTLSLLIFSISLNLWSQIFIDPWNTYQWNKKNVLAKNNKVDTSPWFEWWYYKVTIPQTGKSYYFVYGIVNPWDKNKSLKGTRSYVGMGDFHQKYQVENIFDLDAFKASYEKTEIHVDKNFASDTHFSGYLENKKQNQMAQWDIKIEKQWTFNAEGWLLGTGITDIDWYPAQAAATCSGSIISGKEKIQFEDAPCYQDRNWGKQFPEWWAWIVSNHFDHFPNTVLAVGGGKPTIQTLPAPMGGMFIGLKHQGIEHSFRLNNLNPVVAKISMGEWKLVGMNSTHVIHLDAHAPKDKFMDLQFMTPQGEIYHDYETLNGNVTIKLYKRVGWQYFLQDKLFSSHTGIEYGSFKEFN